MFELTIKAVVFLLRIVLCILYSVLSCLIKCCPTLSCLALPPPVLKQRRHRALQGPGVSVCGFSVSLCTVGGQRQYWGGRHGAGSSTGYSYRPASVCAKSSLHTHNRHCVQFLPTPSFVLSGSFSLPPIPSTSSTLFFCLEQVGLHWSRHLGCRWEAKIAEGLRTDLGIRDQSLNLQDTKRWKVEGTWKKLSRVALQTAWQRGTRKVQGTLGIFYF